MSQKPIKLNVEPLFPLGRLVATPAAIEAIENASDEPGTFLSRHIQGDWGEVDADDKRANDNAVLEMTRILSAYRTAKGVTLWIITEADRSSTCILLPDEY